MAWWWDGRESPAKSLPASARISDYAYVGRRPHSKQWWAHERIVYATSLTRSRQSREDAALGVLAEALDRLSPELRAEGHRLVARDRKRKRNRVALRASYRRAT